MFRFPKGLIFPSLVPICSILAFFVVFGSHRRFPPFFESGDPYVPCGWVLVGKFCLCLQQHSLPGLQHLKYIGTSVIKVVSCFGSHLASLFLSTGKDGTLHFSKFLTSLIKSVMSCKVSACTKAVVKVILKCAGAPFIIIFFMSLETGAPNGVLVLGW
jgi:hypothetical protein